MLNFRWVAAGIYSYQLLEDLPNNQLHEAEGQAPKLLKGWKTIWGLWSLIMGI